MNENIHELEAQIASKKKIVEFLEASADIQRKRINELKKELLLAKGGQEELKL